MCQRSCWCVHIQYATGLRRPQRPFVVSSNFFGISQATTSIASIICWHNLPPDPAVGEVLFLSFKPYSHSSYTCTCMGQAHYIHTCTSSSWVLMRLSPPSLMCLSPPSLMCLSPPSLMCLSPPSLMCLSPPSLMCLSPPSLMRLSPPSLRLAFFVCLLVCFTRSSGGLKFSRIFTLVVNSNHN